MKLEPGMYLVGRNDGGIEPFFAEVDDEYKVVHNVPADLIVPAIAGKGWWWHRMRVPECLPDDEALAKIPGYRKERGPR